MNNSESGFNAFNNNIEQPIGAEQIRQPSPEEIEKLGSGALNGYGPNGIFVEQQAQGAPEAQETQEIQEVQEVQETPIPATTEIPDVRPPQPEEITSVINELAGVEWHQPLAESIQPVSETAPDDNETETAHENLAHKIFEKAKGSRAFKTVVALGLTATMALSLAACGANRNANQAVNESTAQMESTTMSGEQSNGLHYDYSGYNSPEKLNRNNFGEDLRKYHGNRDAMVEAMMGEAEKNPEMLVSEAYHILTPSQKERAGIANMSIDQIDNALNGEDGGKYQQAIFRELNTVMHDKEHTEVIFFTANGRAWSALEYNIDRNGDGQQTPDETFIGTSPVYRNNVKQYKVINAPNDQEKTETNINEYCGAQPDTPEKPEGVKEISPDEVVETPPETSTEESTENTHTDEWGKEGDPHGGPDVTPSDKVDPNSEVSKEQNDDTNKGNQGYVDDNQATPGSSSDNNGSYNEDRLSGGENQGGDQTNGTNAYNNPEQNNQGQQVDNSGNESQQQAQDAGVKPGEDNYSDAEEENPDNW